MSIIGDKNKVLRLLNFYEHYLNTVNDDVFLRSPAPGVWSFSEVFSHVLWVLQTSLLAIENCLNKTAPMKTKSPDWRVRIILFIGFLPPIKFKAPTVAASKVKKISKEEASNQIVAIRKKITYLMPEFKKYEAKYKVKHPVMGYLDAKSWLRFMVVHTKHHISQLSRLEKNNHEVI